MSVGFEWDSRKAASNRNKHSVSFDEATTVFDDPLAVIFPDPNHSLRERREIIVGHSINNRLIWFALASGWKKPLESLARAP